MLGGETEIQKWSDFLKRDTDWEGIKDNHTPATRPWKRVLNLIARCVSMMLVKDLPSFASSPLRIVYLPAAICCVHTEKQQAAGAAGAGRQKKMYIEAYLKKTTYRAIYIQFYYRF